MTTATRSENVCFMAVESRLLDLTIGCGLYLYVGNGIYVPDQYPECAARWNRKHVTVNQLTRVRIRDLHTMRNYF